MVVINGTTGIDTIQDNTVTSAKIVDGSVTNTDLQTPYRMVQMTPVDMTNGGANNLTFKDFTGIPSWAKRITVMFAGVSTRGTSALQVQIGTSLGIENSGYSGINTAFGTSAVTQNTAFTTGAYLYLGSGELASALRYGKCIIENCSLNTFLLYGDIGASSSYSCKYNFSKTMARKCQGDDTTIERLDAALA